MSKPNPASVVMTAMSDRLGHQEGSVDRKQTYRKIIVERFMQEGAA